MAELARLELSDAEAQAMAKDLETVLAYAESLQSVDTSGVEPTAHVLSFATPLREDLAATPLDPERAVANAPVHAGTAFVVPKVIDGEDGG